MNKVHRKITALLTASFMTVMSMGVVSAQTDNNAQIKSIDAENGTVTVAPFYRRTIPAISLTLSPSSSTCAIRTNRISSTSCARCRDCSA